MKKILIATLLISGLATFSYGDLLLTEDFTYSNGNLEDVAVPPWYVNSGSGDYKLTVSGNELVKSSSGGETMTRTFTGTTSGDDYYFSFTANFSSLPGTGNTRVFAGLNNESPSGYRLSIGGTQDGATGGGYFLGLGSSSSSISGFGTTELSLDTDYLIVGYYNNDTATAKLWIDPSSELDAAYVTGTGSTAAGTDGFFFKASSSGGAATFDTLLVGETFSDVTAVPEPATIGFMFVGLAGLFFARRRMNG